MNEYSKYETEFMKDAAYPITWKKAKGCNVWDSKDKKYLDFTSGIFVTNVGHANDRIKEAIIDQLNQDLLFSFSFPTEIRKKFVDKLMSMVPSYLNKVCLYTTGSGSTDRAIQIARKHTGKKYIASVAGAFHGNTSLWQGICKSPKYKIVFPLSDKRKFNKDVQKWNSDNIAAFILEGYQGWSAYFYPTLYISKLEDWCRKNGVILIMDEIQSGFKRTGPLFCFQHYGIHPDLVVFGKGASGCLPLSGILGRSEIMKCMDNEKFTSTHSGNTLVMAAALANINEMDALVSKDIVEKGVYLVSLLTDLQSKYPRHITFVTGKGLLASVHFINETFSDRVTRRCIINGLMLVRTGKKSLKIGPPLIVEKGQIKEGISIIDRSIGEEIT